jgi:hypothetical protein
VSEPDETAPEILRDGVDLHIHSGPDIFARNVDAAAAARQAKAAGMAAIVVKSHSTDTSARAETAREQTGFPVFGGIVLNYPVGGLNEYAVRESAKQGGRIVWMPTIGARHFIQNSQSESAGMLASAVAPGVTGLTATENGKVKGEVLRILDLIVENDLTLASGHLAPEETLAVFEEATKRGITRLIVTHPHLPFVGMPEDIMVQLADLGGYLEICDHESIEDRLSVVRAVGAERCFLSTDGGKESEPVPVERLRRSAQGLRDAGLSAEEIRRMVATNPAFLLNLTAADLA